MEMYTLQDLQAVGEGEKDLVEFVKKAIDAHKGTGLYKMAIIANDYDRQQNTTIIQYQKLLYKVTGEAVPDNFSANYKLCSNFFDRLITQLNQYLLGNGCTWQNDDTKEKVGPDFDARLQEAGHEALMSGESFGFWNYDHMEVFNLREFAPIYDEENGALSAGIRFWQVSPKRYKTIAKYTPADNTYIYDGENYDGFPIIPLWGNPHRQSELVGMRENIDAYDLIKSGFCNTIDDTSLIYWTINNAGGMDEMDLAQFLDQMKRVRAAVVSKNATAEAHTIDVPTASREAILDRLRSDLYEDFMALDVKTIASGAVTATQIKAAYEPINSKADKFEFQVLEFIRGILQIAGIEDSPTFNRSQITNTNEEIQIILQAAQYLPETYVTKKIVSMLGDNEALEDILADIDNENMDRLTPEEDEEAESIPEPEPAAEE